MVQKHPAMIADPALPAPVEVVAFWRDAGPTIWFAKDDAFDAAFRLRFEPAHCAAARGELEHWLTTADGALALVLLLDQFPRNCFRGTARAYATDGQGRHYANSVIASGVDAQVDAALRVFVYLPFEHSEDIAEQDRAVELIRALGNDTYTNYAIRHRDVIARFGRFPHRNREIGRVNTAEEQAWLDAGGGF